MKKIKELIQVGKPSVVSIQTDSFDLWSLCFYKSNLYLICKHIFLGYYLNVVYSLGLFYMGIG